MPTMTNHPMMLKLGASIGMALFFALQFHILNYRRNTLHLDDNGVLAIIGLATICYGLITLITSAIAANTRRKNVEQAQRTLQDAIDMGVKLAEDDALEKLSQKTRAASAPPDQVL
jgi:hypothetical protein